MATFQFVHGDPLMVDYTPSGADVGAGDLVIFAGKACIAHNDIPDGTLGAISWPNGRAVYEIVGDIGDGFDDTDVDDISAGGSLTYGTDTYFNGAGTLVGVVTSAVVAGATDGVQIING